jgi:nucleotidyltransferase/DNA polymerase involved in DNA repair
MRKIVYLGLETDSIDAEILETCSGHSSLLEPIDERELLLDLSPFNRVGDILRGLAEAVAQQIKGRAAIGLASSPLLAMLAVQRSSRAAVPKSAYRCFQLQQIEVIQVLPGKEALFISTLPLEEFPPLSAREAKLLRRLGYLQVGELAVLGQARLQRILKRDAWALWQNSCGRDYRPVKGLYPPERLGYSLALAEGCLDRIRLLQSLAGIAQELSDLLGQRHAACKLVQLQLELGEGQILNLERQLSQACQDRSRLNLILRGLLPEVIEQPVTGFRVGLAGLQTVEMRTQDLFTLRYTHQEEAKQQHRTAVMEQLLQRFPDSIGLGMEIERREKILRFWDPWRFSPEGG